MVMFAKVARKRVPSVNVYRPPRHKEQVLTLMWVSMQWMSIFFCFSRSFSLPRPNCRPMTSVVISEPSCMSHIHLGKQHNIACKNRAKHTHWQYVQYLGGSPFSGPTPGCAAPTPCSRRNASGMVNVDVIQQYVFTGLVGSPSTMHWIGLPTYCVAVTIMEQASSTTVVNVTCIRKTVPSMVTGCRLTNSLSPPNSFNMLRVTTKTTTNTTRLIRIQIRIRTKIRIGIRLRL